MPILGAFIRSPELDALHTRTQPGETRMQRLDHVHWPVEDVWMLLAWACRFSDAMLFTSWRAYRVA